MTRSNADLMALKLELTNNPMTLSGYLPLITVNDVGNADALNLIRTETQVERKNVPMKEIIQVIDMDEFIALTPAQQNWLIMISNAGTIDPSTTSETREGMMALFPGGSGTRQNMLAMVNENANRVEHLYRAGTLQVGGTVTPSDIADCRRI